MMTKQELRQLIRSRKLLHDSNDAAASIIDSLKQHPRLTQAQTVLLYSALPDEVPTQELIDHLVEQGKMVLLPRVVSDTDMELRKYTGQHDLQKGAYGIMEPAGELFTDYAAIDVAIVPGMAFDSAGHRLGRGKGYYDRFLSRVPNIYKIGLCFSWQIVDSVPSDAHDVRMDMIIQIGHQ